MLLAYRRLAIPCNFFAGMLKRKVSQIEYPEGFVGRLARPQGIIEVGFAVNYLSLCRTLLPIVNSDRVFLC
jgi:hypothetical protein